MASTILSDNGVSSGSAGLKSSADSTGVLALQTSTSGGTATTAVTIDTSQQVGIGTTPSTWGSGGRALEIGGYVLISSFTNELDLTCNAYYSGGWKYKNTDFASQYYQSSGAHYWLGAGSGTAGASVTGFNTPKMTLDSSGNLLVGTTSSVAGKLQVKNNSGDASTGLNVIESGTNNYWSQYIYTVTHDLYFAYNNTNKGYFQSSTGVYVAVSDQRLKKDIQNLPYGLSEILALRPTSYHMIEQDDSDKKNFGFIAQEAMEVLPECVFEMQGGMYGMDKSAIIPVLVKAIQELKEINDQQAETINALTARIVALEAK
jgi:Chaperone of endosialidase